MGTPREKQGQAGKRSGLGVFARVRKRTAAGVKLLPFPFRADWIGLLIVDCECFCLCVWVDTVAVSVPSGFGAAGGPAARLRLIAGVVMIAAINSAPLAVLPQLAARGACESYCGYCSLLLPVAVQPAAARSAKQERAVTSSSESPARESHLRWKTGHYCCYCCYCYLLRLIEACCCATQPASAPSPAPNRQFP